MFQLFGAHSRSTFSDIREGRDFVRARFSEAGSLPGRPFMWTLLNLFELPLDHHPFDLTSPLWTPPRATRPSWTKALTAPDSRAPERAVDPMAHKHLTTCHSLPTTDAAPP